jgi:HlyD family secretion protein
MRERPKNVQVVWVKNGDAVRPARIKTGVTDGTNIEILSGLNTGDEVVTAMKLAKKNGKEKAKKETQKSPFVPQRPGRGRR